MKAEQLEHNNGALRAIQITDWPASPYPVVQLRHEFSIISEKNESIAGATVEFMNDVLWLTNVWTHHEYRKRGYATAVLNAVIKEFGHRTLYLKVHPYTDRPLSEGALEVFYARFGFEAAGVPGVMRREGRAP